jgi:hypothetical protein
MIKAKEANAITKEVQKKAEAERLAKYNKFLDEVCEPAIMKAANNGQYEAFVEIPAGLQEDTATLTAMIFCEGYVAQMRHGSRPAILIRWDKAK